VTRLVQRRMVSDLGGDLVAQRIAVDLLERLPRLARARAAELAAAHAHLTAALGRHLPAWQVAPAEGGTAVWVRLPRPAAPDVAAAAAARGVHLVAGTVLSPHGGMADHVRLSITQPAAVLDDAVERLTAAWDDVEAAFGSGDPQGR